VEAVGREGGFTFGVSGEAFLIEIENEGVVLFGGGLDRGAVEGEIRVTFVGVDARWRRFGFDGRWRQKNEFGVGMKAFEFFEVGVELGVEFL